MNLIKAIIGGLIGAAIGIVLLYFLKGGKVHGYEWFPIVTGLLTGLGAKALLGSTVTAKATSYLTGAAAAVIAALAILSTDELVMLVRNQSMDMGPAIAQQSLEELKQPIVEDDPATRPPSDEADSDNADDTESESEGQTDDGSNSEDGDSEATTETGDESDEDAGDSDSADETATTDDDESAADDGSEVDRSALEAANTPRLTPTRDGVANSKRKKMGWKQIAPYVFSILGVLCAYQLGKTRAVEDEVVVHHDHTDDVGDEHGSDDQDHS